MIAIDLLKDHNILLCDDKILCNVDLRYNESNDNALTSQKTFCFPELYNKKTVCIIGIITQNPSILNG